MNPNLAQDPSLNFSRPLASETDFKRAQVRRGILAASKHIFARYGYDGATLFGLAQGAGISVGELLSHFGDKYALLIETLNDCWEVINQRLSDDVLTSLNAREAAFSIVTTVMNILDRDEDLARILLFESRCIHPKTGEIIVSDGYRQLVRLSIELAARGQRDGSFSSALHPRIIATLLIAGAEGLLREKVLAESDGETFPYPEFQLISALGGMVSQLRPVADDVRDKAPLPV